MKHFDNFEKHLRQEGADLPEGFAWDEMEEAIFDKVDADTPQNGAKGLAYFKNRKNILIALLSLLTVVLGTLLYQSNTSYTLSDENKIVKQEQTPTLPSIDQNNTPFTNVEASKGVEIATDSRNTDLNTRQDIGSEPSDNTQATDLSNKTTVDQSLSSEVVGSNMLLKRGKSDQNKSNSISSQVEKTQASNRQERSNLGRSTKKKSMPTELDENLEVNNENSANTLDKNSEFNTYEPSSKVILSKQENLAHKQVGVGFEQENTVLSRLDGLHREFKLTKRKIEINNELRTFDKMNTSPLNKWSFLLAGGVNSWSLSPLSRSQNIYNFTSSQIGLSLEGQVQLELNENWFLSAGIGYSKLQSKVDAQFESTQIRTVKDALIEICHNPISGITAEVRRDSFVVDSIRHRIVHHNSYQAFQLPILINWKTKVNTWHAGLGLGPSVTFLKSYDGRYIQSDAAVDFGTKDRLYNKGLTLAVNGRLFIEKEAFSKISIGVSLSLSKSLQDWGMDDKSSIRPSIFSQQVYLRHTF